MGANAETWFCSQRFIGGNGRHQFVGLGPGKIWIFKGLREGNTAMAQVGQGSGECCSAGGATGSADGVG